MPCARALLVLLFAAAAAAISVAAAGCDSSGTQIPVSVSADGGGPDVIVFFDGPTPFEAALPADAGMSETAPASDAAAFAFVEFSEVPVGGGAFTAAFFATPLQPAPGCTSAAVDGGACLVTTCVAHAAADAGVVTLAPAGALDVTGGAFGDAGVEIGADNLGSYLYNTTGPMFAPGDTLAVSGAGATVPAFPAQTLVAPGAITITSPSAGDAGALVVSTSKDLVVAWTGGATGDRVVFTLTALFMSGGSTSTACSWDAATGQGTIPAAALASLAGTTQAGGSTAVWYQEAHTAFAAGRWAVTMRAAIHGGSLASFQ